MDAVVSGTPDTSTPWDWKALPGWGLEGWQSFPEESKWMSEQRVQRLVSKWMSEQHVQRLVSKWMSEQHVQRLATEVFASSLMFRA